MPTKLIDRTELNLWLEESRALVLIDTGLAEDHAAGHIRGALNACVFEVDFLEKVTALNGITQPGATNPDREVTLVVYGASHRSLTSADAAKKLAAAGFNNVLDYRGGLEEWRAAGLPLEGDGQSHSEILPRDGAHTILSEQSVVEWTGRSLGGKHHGTVSLVPGGTITMSGGRLVAGSFCVDMTSINDTDLADTVLRKMLHDHLASEDFFDVANYPHAFFQLESVEEVPDASPGEPNYVVNGRLTLKGVENPLSFKILAGYSPTGDGSLVARTNFDLDRTEWNVLYGSGKFYEKLGRHLVNDLITLDLKIVAR